MCPSGSIEKILCDVPLWVNSNFTCFLVYFMYISNLLEENLQFTHNGNGVRRMRDER